MSSKKPFTERCQDSAIPFLYFNQPRRDRWSEECFHMELLLQEFIMSMLLNHHMELLNIAELAPETYTMFMGRNVAQNTHKKQRTMCRNSVNTKKLMYIQIFTINVYLCCAAKRVKRYKNIMKGTDCRHSLLCTQSFYPAYVVYQHWNNCEHTIMNFISFTEQGLSKRRLLHCQRSDSYSQHMETLLLFRRLSNSLCAKRQRSCVQTGEECRMTENKLFSHSKVASFEHCLVLQFAERRESSDCNDRMSNRLTGKTCLYNFNFWVNQVKIIL